MKLLFAERSEEMLYEKELADLSEFFGFKDSVLSRCAADITKGLSCFDEFYPAGHTDSAMIAAAAETINRNFHIKTPESECEIIGCLYRIMTILIKNHYREENNLDIMKRNKHFLQELSLFLEQNFLVLQNLLHQNKFLLFPRPFPYTDGIRDRARHLCAQDRFLFVPAWQREE